MRLSSYHVRGSETLFAVERDQHLVRPRVVFDDLKGPGATGSRRVDDLEEFVLVQEVERVFAVDL